MTYLQKFKSLNF